MTDSLPKHSPPEDWPPPRPPKQPGLWLCLQSVPRVPANTVTSCSLHGHSGSPAGERGSSVTTTGAGGAPRFHGCCAGELTGKSQREDTGDRYPPTSRHKSGSSGDCRRTQNLRASPWPEASVCPSARSTRGPGDVSRVLVMVGPVVIPAPALPWPSVS